MECAAVKSQLGTASDICQRLFELLKSNGLVAEISRQFSQLGNDEARVLFAETLLKKYHLDFTKIVAKNATEKYRKECREEDVIKSNNGNDEIPNVDSKNESIQCASNAVKLDFTAELGRHVLATRDIKIGEVLAVEKPYASILLKEHYKGFCHNCLRSSKTLIECDQCRLARFCSVDCLKDSLKYHQYECPILNHLILLDFHKLKLIALRIALLAWNSSNLGEAKRNDTCYHSEEYKEIDELCSHTELRSVADLFNKSVHAALIVNLLDESNFFESQDSKGKFCKLILKHMQTGPANFHEITKFMRLDDSEIGEMEQPIEIGAGAYSFLSMLNHSCNPNAVRHCYGTTLVLRALRPIGKGQQVFDNYGYHYATMNKQERQESLRSQYFFECHCEVCTQNWPMYDSLPNLPQKPGITAEDIEKLKVLDHKVAKDFLAILLPMAESLEDDRPCRNLAECQECIKHCYNKLSCQECAGSSTESN